MACTWRVHGACTISHARHVHGVYVAVRCVLGAYIARVGLVKARSRIVHGVYMASTWTVHGRYLHILSVFIA